MCIHHVVYNIHGTAQNAAQNACRENALKQASDSAEGQPVQSR